MAESDNKTGSNTGCFNKVIWILGLNLVWILLAAFAVWMGWRAYTLSFKGEVVTGTVVSYVEEDLSDSFADIYPVVEFQLDGETYSVRSENNYRWWNQYTRFGIGKQVEMRYDPSDPEHAEINSWLDIWGEPIILGVFSIVAAIVINGYLIFRWRTSNKLPQISV